MRLVWIGSRCWTFSQDTVCRDHEIVRRCKCVDVLDRVLKVQADTELTAPLVQQLQQPLARQAAEAVPCTGDLVTAIERVDVGPVGEVRLDAREALGIRGL